MRSRGFQDIGCTCDECSGANPPKTGHCCGCRQVFELSKAVKKDGKDGEKKERVYCSEHCACKKGAK